MITLILLRYPAVPVGEARVYTRRRPRVISRYSQVYPGGLALAGQRVYWDTFTDLLVFY